MRASRPADASGVPRRCSGRRAGLAAARRAARCAPQRQQVEAAARPRPARPTAPAAASPACGPAARRRGRARGRCRRRRGSPRRGRARRRAAPGSARIRPAPAARMAPSPALARAHHVAHVGRRIGLDQALRQRRRLDQEEPVPVGAGEGLGRLLVHGQRRRDVEQHQPLAPLRMVQRQPVRDAGAAVVRRAR